MDEMPAAGIIEPTIRKFSTTFEGTGNAWVELNHNLNTQDVFVVAYDEKREGFPISVTGLSENKIRVSPGGMNDPVLGMLAKLGGFQGKFTIIVIG